MTTETELREWADHWLDTHRPDREPVEGNDRTWMDEGARVLSGMWLDTDQASKVVERNAKAYLVTRDGQRCRSLRGDIRKWHATGQFPLDLDTFFNHPINIAGYRIKFGHITRNDVELAEQEARERGDAQRDAEYETADAFAAMAAQFTGRRRKVVDWAKPGSAF